jgi:hypothetical protein
MTSKTEPLLPMYLSAAEIAKRIMPMHPRTLKRAQGRGEIVGHLHNGKWRFNTQSVLAWIAGRGIEPEPAMRRGRPRKAAKYSD